MLQNDTKTPNIEDILDKSLIKVYNNKKLDFISNFLIFSGQISPGLWIGDKFSENPTPDLANYALIYGIVAYATGHILNKFNYNNSKKQAQKYYEKGYFRD
jgi:hypothetical protein